jgi:hypothetical protein
MPFKYFKYFEKDNISDGHTYEDTWRADEDLTIKRIYIARKDGASFTKSTFFFKIKETVYTHEVVPCVCIGADKLTSPELDIPFKTGEILAFTLKNLEGAPISVMVTFECWSP